MAKTQFSSRKVHTALVCHGPKRVTRPRLTRALQLSLFCHLPLNADGIVGNPEPEGRCPNDCMEQSAPQTHVGLRFVYKLTLLWEATEIWGLITAVVYSDLNNHVRAARAESPADN